MRRTLAFAILFSVFVGFTTAFLFTPAFAEGEVAIAFAQAGGDVPTEVSFWTDFPVVEAANAMVTLLTMFLSWLIVKKLVPMIPNWLIPILAGTVLPWLSTWLISMAAQTDLVWWKASLYGLAATVVHQLYKQLSEGAKSLAAKWKGRNGGEIASA